MDPNTQALLNGTLKSPDGGDSTMVSFANSLSIPISPYYLDWKGAQWCMTDSTGAYIVIPPSSTTAPLECYSGNWYFFRSASTGSFICLLQGGDDITTPPVLPDGETINVTSSMLQPPNDIGMFPFPNSDQVIPGNSPRVLVGTGSLPNGNAVVREQYWALANDSYMLEPRSERTISTTNVSGMQRTSSSTEEISGSVSADASASFWGVSASLSASLSQSSSCFQQVQVTEQVTQYEEYKLHGDPKGHAKMYLKWQLTDVVTVLANGGAVVKASMVTAQSPTIIDGPYDPLSSHLGTQTDSPRTSTVWLHADANGATP